MIWTIFSTIFMFISVLGAYFNAKYTKNKTKKIKDNLIANCLYFFSNIYNCVYFFSTIAIIETQGVYAVRDILFFVVSCIGIYTYSKQLKEQKRNERSSDNS